jgi:hypothetical protein
VSGGELPAPQGEDQPQVLQTQQRLFEQFLGNQAQEMELKSKELSLQQQKDSNSFDFGKASLSAQLEDRKDERKTQLESRKDTSKLVALLAIIIATVIVFALKYDKEAFALEVIKSIVFVLVGGAGGYGIAKSQEAKTKAQEKVSN